MTNLSDEELEKMVQRIIESSYKPNELEELKTLTLNITKALRTVRDEALAEGRREKDDKEEITSEWQDKIRNLFIEAGVPSDQIDGAGTDSGSAFDFTESEIIQGINYLVEKAQTPAPLPSDKTEAESILSKIPHFKPFAFDGGIKLMFDDGESLRIAEPYTKLLTTWAARIRTEATRLERELITKVESALKPIAEKMIGQDNRCTAHPIFHVYQIELRESLDGEIEKWFNDDWDEVEYDENDEQFKDKHTKVCYTEVSVPVSGHCYFSEKSAQEHINANHYHYHKPHIYVESAYRNSEWQAIRKVIDAIRNRMKEVEGGKA